MRAKMTVHGDCNVDISKISSFEDEIMAAFKSQGIRYIEGEISIYPQNDSPGVWFEYFPKELPSYTTVPEGCVQKPGEPVKHDPVSAWRWLQNQDWSLIGGIQGYSGFQSGFTCCPWTPIKK